MKSLLLAGVLLMGAAGRGSAIGLPENYFRLIDISHPQIVGGAAIDYRDLNNSEVIGLVPVFTHSPKDGCLLPSIVCENWSPLALGASVNAGQYTFTAAPVMNVLPWMQAAALSVMPEAWLGVRGVVGQRSDRVSFSGGPAWQYKTATNKGYFRIFTGATLSF